ncbi:MAG TPA: NAD(P)-binding protein [Acetobacteraceae bacterium]|nr:NAD(P)-binding protein [Acetobacteraceae bacterium]
MQTLPDGVVIGAGFGGLDMAMRLKAAGEDSVLILEQANDVGRSWRDNTRFSQPALVRGL